MPTRWYIPRLPVAILFPSTSAAIILSDGNRQTPFSSFPYPLAIRTCRVSKTHVRMFIRMYVDGYVTYQPQFNGQMKISFEFALYDLARPSPSSSSKIPLSYVYVRIKRQVNIVTSLSFSLFVPLYDAGVISVILQHFETTSSVKIGEWRMRIWL